MLKSLIFAAFCVTFVAALPRKSSGYVDAVSGESGFRFLEKFYEIANADPAGTRAVATGYNASAEFVEETLKESGFIVNRQYLTVPVHTILGTPELALFLADGDTVNFIEGQDFTQMRYGGMSAEVTGRVVYVENNGCDLSDFESVRTGDVVLMEDGGSCDLQSKCVLSEQSGAAASLIHRSLTSSGYPGGRARAVDWKEGDPILVNPVLAVSGSVAQLLMQTFSSVVTLKTEAVTNLYRTYNLFVETDSGDENNVVTIGAHLDSVPEGPGLDDNASGSSSVLELATKFNDLNLTSSSKIRFFWWGAEEIGLLGSRHYVRELIENERSKIALNINLDMTAAPNYQIQVHRGSDAPEAVRAESIKIQEVYEQYFLTNEIPYVLTAMTGGSDFLPFLEGGIPAGGMNTGAADLKTMEGRTTFGGFANAQKDPCYHLPCDTIENIDKVAFNHIIKASAYALETLAGISA